MLKNLLAALKDGSWAPDLNALIMVGTTIGIETTDQANSLTAVVGGVASLVSIIIGAVHTFRGTKLIAAQRTADGSYRITNKE